MSGTSTTSAAIRLTVAVPTDKNADGQKLNQGQERITASGSKQTKFQGVAAPRQLGRNDQNISSHLFIYPSCSLYQTKHTTRQCPQVSIPQRKQRVQPKVVTQLPGTDYPVMSLNNGRVFTHEVRGNEPHQQHLYVELQRKLTRAVRTEKDGLMPSNSPV